MIDWPRISSAFESDGSLRDVYILDASLTDWERAWAFLLGIEAELTLQIGGEQVLVPDDVGPIFVARQRGDTATLSCRFGRVTLNCHFFAQEEVEFDVDPREIDNADAACDLTSFMVGLCEATSMEILLTAENNREGVIAKVSPGSRNIRWL